MYLRDIVLLSAQCSSGKNFRLCMWLYMNKYHHILCERQLVLNETLVKFFLPFPISDWPLEVALHAVETEQADPLKWEKRRANK